MSRSNELGKLIFECYFGKGYNHSTVFIYFDGEHVILKYVNLQGKKYLVDSIYKFPLDANDEVAFNIDKWLDVYYDGQKNLSFYKGKQLIMRMNIKVKEESIMIDNIAFGKRIIF